MKRYYVAAFDCYYPMGGFNDVCAAYETEREAKDAAMTYIHSNDVVEVWKRDDDGVLSFVWRV